MLTGNIALSGEPGNDQIGDRHPLLEKYVRTAIRRWAQSCHPSLSRIVHDFGKAAPRGRHCSNEWEGWHQSILFYTLFETAKLSDIENPGAYVTLAAKRAIVDHGAVTLPSDLT